VATVDSAAMSNFLIKIIQQSNTTTAQSGTTAVTGGIQILSCILIAHLELDD
jgi:hypothetical protein